MYQTYIRLPQRVAREGLNRQLITHKAAFAMSRTGQNGDDIEKNDR
jgi:hypothetical protein